MKASPRPIAAGLGQGQPLPLQRREGWPYRLTQGESFNSGSTP
jgi:hypothetical protein